MYDLKWQSEKINQDKPVTKIIDACTLGDGICSLAENEIEEFLELFELFQGSTSMFIPASGSGSRMFECISDSLIDDKLNNKESQLFFEKLSQFAFYENIPEEFLKNLNAQQGKLEVIKFLLLSHGLNFKNLPKGLIPFHKEENSVFNPFQEHIRQGIKIKSDIKFHFTIQEDFKNDIVNSIDNQKEKCDFLSDISYSHQSKETDSFVFSDKGDLLLDENQNFLKRPAGHGALIENLNAVKTDLVFVKNIDNVQHFSRSHYSILFFRVLAGMLLRIKKDIVQFQKELNMEELHRWNDKYFVFSSSELKTDLNYLFNRPIRVCGMVKNQGEPGGGPFWIEEGKVISKQIVEGSQIQDSKEQMEIFQKGSHFNPVFMVLDPNHYDKQSDLSDYSNSNRYLKVNKKMDGHNVQFIERPGLWNGSMENWTTIFVEVPLDVFSPVKSVMDLLNKPHLSVNS